MSPTWARKGSKRWRYYVSQAVLQGDKSKAGSIVRVPAGVVEALVTNAIAKPFSNHTASQTDIRNLINRVVIGRATIRIQLSEVAEEDDSARILTLPWTRPSPYRKREIIQAANDVKTSARPMPANARATLIEALRDAHRWLDVGGMVPLGYRVEDRALHNRRRSCRDRAVPVSPLSRGGKRGPSQTATRR
jgi:site-specific DNA recombinase